MEKEIRAVIDTELKKLSNRFKRKIGKRLMDNLIEKILYEKDYRLDVY